MHPTLVPEVFFCCEETRQEKERSGKRKPLVAGDANLTIMLQLAVNQHHEIDQQATNNDTPVRFLQLEDRVRS